MTDEQKDPLEALYIDPSDPKWKEVIQANLDRRISAELKTWTPEMRRRLYELMRERIQNETSH